MKIYLTTSALPLQLSGTENQAQLLKASSKKKALESGALLKEKCYRYLINS